MSFRDTLPCDIKARYTNTDTGVVTLRNFKLTKVLGKGGMGTVYLAIDKDHPRSLLDSEEPAYVAIKYINDCPSDDENGVPPEVFQRFKRECAVLRRLHHPNVIHVHDLWRDQDDEVLLAMEYVDDAQTLEEVVALYASQVRKGGKAQRSVVPMRLLLGIMRQLLSGIHELHANGIIHRDLKPPNILLKKRAGGFLLKIMDFGIAKDTQYAGPKITREHALIGTPEYMSPEQAFGKEVEASTDMWAFGVILYELVTGVLPFQATDEILKTDGSNQQANWLEVIIKIKQEDFLPIEKSVEGVDPDIARMIDRCLHKNPNGRLTIPEAQALLEMAEDTQREEDARADLDTLPGGAPASARRRSKPMAPAVPQKNPVPEPEPYADRRGFADVEPPEEIPLATASPSFHWRYVVIAAMFVGIGIFAAWFFVRHDAETPIASPPQAAPMAEPSQAAPVASPVPPAAPAPTASAKSAPGVGPPPGSKEDVLYKSGLAHAAKKECRAADLELLLTISRFPGLLPALKAEAECLVLMGDRKRAQKYAAVYLQYEGTDAADFSPALRALLTQPAPSPR